MGRLLASTAPAPDPDDVFAFWTFKDLHQRRIVFSRTDLSNKIARYGFPRPIVLTGGVGANAVYKIADVKAWLQQREKAGARNAPPELKPGSRPRGRPRKDALQEEQPTTQ